MKRALQALLVAVLAMLWAPPAQAKVELTTPLGSHVVDPNDLLPAADEALVERRLADTRRTRGFTIVALVVSSLDGEPIEDLAYRAFNTWGVGDSERDDGILLVIAADEMRTRIETGKGIGGDLTDLESAEILRDVVSAPLHAGKIAQAVDAGTQAIEERLSDRASSPGPADNKERDGGFPWPFLLLLLLGGLSLFSPTARLALFSILGSLSFGGGGGGLGGGRRDSFGGGGGGSSGGGGANGN
jgi:uncharacterized protein